MSRQCLWSALLPFANEDCGTRLNGHGFGWRNHLTLNCFDRAAHMIASILDKLFMPIACDRDTVLGKDLVSVLSMPARYAVSAAG
jgi:hypothetical protein